ncbi:MAG: BON domain-containing protein [Burkholderiaceae bacterium]|jgi:osmotically-inducible protein OsmY|nr:BON domain-containing protein [Burkholderiaceae bacterium]
MKHLFPAIALIAALGAAVSGCAVGSGQSTAGQYVDDTTITTRVKARYAKDPEVAATRISVETLKGVVQLSGFAASATEKQRAVSLAREVPGVKDVKDDIIVQKAQ